MSEKMKRYWVFSTPTYYPAGGMLDCLAADNADPRELFDAYDLDTWHVLDMTTSPPTLVRFKPDSGSKIEEVLAALKTIKANCGVVIDCVAQYETYDGDAPELARWQLYSARFSDKVNGLICPGTIQPGDIFERKDD